MKKFLFLLLSCAAFCGMDMLSTAEPWRDPNVSAINREPMRSSFIVYPSAEDALRADRCNNPMYMSLDGMWNFSFWSDISHSPADFFATGFNDSGWQKISVPGMWQLNGYVDPVYLNKGHVWKHYFDNDPPNIPDEGNFVGCYRRKIELPAEWKGKEVFLHFGSVTSCVTLWVNGREVGYSEDSKLPAEFNVTKYLRPGENTIALRVMRFCDGTYLEDQDFWLLNGLARETYAYARDKAHLKDIRITPDLVNDYKDGTLDVEIQAAPGVKQVELQLLDGANEIAARTLTPNGKGSSSYRFAVASPRKWSAEEPNLYKLLVTVRSKSGVTESFTQQIGFRKSEIKDKRLHINGQPVLIKGVNRHEMTPNGGYHVTREDMERDLRICKELNINAIRTCHYPDDPYFYELCNEYGFYVVDEANIESHSMGYGERTLAKNPVFAKAHLERNQRMVLRDKNQPCIVIWSLGNEAGDGPNFDACYDWIKGYDQSRPVQYEQAHGGRNTDIFCPMYHKFTECEEYLTNDPQKPLIQCEYAHAMANSMGGFKEYWDLIRKYPMYQGGFIWDFVDTGFHRYGEDGSISYTYGGDYNKYDESRGSFNANGLVSPDRLYNPHAWEVKYVQRFIQTSPEDATGGKIKVYNENFFTGLSKYYMRWELTENGIPFMSGVVWDVDVAPRQTKEFALGYSSEALAGRTGEIFLNVEYLLKSEDGLLPAGHSVAWEQMSVRGKDASQAITFTAGGETPALKNDFKYYYVSGADWKIEFSRQSGWMESFIHRGCELLSEPLTPNFNRAPVENDLGAKLDKKYAAWRYPEFKPVSMGAEVRDGFVVVTTKHMLESTGAEITLEYIINGRGEVKITEDMKADKTKFGVTPMFRYGVTFAMPARYNKVEYFGRGPVENYADRKASANVGLYRQDVADQYYGYYPRPQESGTKSDLRWWKVTDIGGQGVEIVSQELFSASALPYSISDLDSALPSTVKHSGELKGRNTTFVNLDLLQMGVGCENSWGAMPRDEYMIPYGDYRFTFILRPL